MTKKATHYGTCQLCGSLQKLPGGVLATHGYQIEWHQFHGICRGTGFAPFEKSKRLALEQISLSEQYLATFPELPEPEISRFNYHVRTKDPAVIAYRERRDTRRAHQSMISWLKPRCEQWVERPLLDVAEEDRKTETVKVASRNVRELARLRNDAKYDLSKAIDAVDKIVGWSEFGCLNSSNCVNVATRILTSNGTNSYGHSFDLADAEAAISHLLTAQAVWLEAKAKADEAKAAFEADKKAALKEAQQ